MRKELSFLLVCMALSTNVWAENLLTNGDFNNGNFGSWWTWADNNTTQSFDIEPTDGYTYDGTNNVRLWSSQNWGPVAFGQTIENIGENLEYAFSFVYSARWTENWGTADWLIKYYDASWGELGYEWDTLYHESPAPNAEGQWLEFRREFITPPGTVHADFQIRAYNWTTVNVDNVSIEPLADPDAIEVVYPINESSITWEEVLYSSGGLQLRWNSAASASAHSVYFGRDEAAVTDANESSAEYRGQQPLAETTHPVQINELELGGTYFWRVDEVIGGEPVKGRTLSFSVNGYRIVDDFDLYRDGYHVVEPGYWVDGELNGTGSWMYWGEEDVHEGRGAVRVQYDNSIEPRLSELTRTCYLTDPNLLRCSGDWVSGNVKLLTLALHGTESFAEDVYVIVQSDNGESGIVYYDNPAELRQGAHEWYRWWYIDLAEFATQGVDLQRITAMTIGIGNKGNPTTGGTGDLYVDSIRLFPAICINRDNDADINNDCNVDFADVLALAGDWLESSRTINQSPPAATPVLWYKFDEGTGFQALDSSGRNKTGNLIRSSWSVGGGFDGGNCLDMGNDTYVEVPLDAIDASTWGAESTVAFWLKDPGQSDGDSMLLQTTNDPGKLEIWTGSTGNMNYVCGYNTSTGYNDMLTFGGSYMLSNPDHPLDRWVHYAFVKSAASGYMRIYQDGRIVAEWEGAIGTGMTTPEPGTHFFSIGAWRWSGGSGGFYDGLMDDFRIYDSALSQEEILSLAVAGGTAVSPLTQDLTSPADVDKDNVVSLLDLAVIGENWLDKPLVYP